MNRARRYHAGTALMKTTLTRPELDQSLLEIDYAAIELRAAAEGHQMWQKMIEQQARSVIEGGSLCVETAELNRLTATLRHATKSHTLIKMPQFKDALTGRTKT